MEDLTGSEKLTFKSVRLSDISNSYFSDAWKLYEKSFPIDERRTIDSQKMTMQKPEYNFDIITQCDVLLGILLWWKFDTLRYIEHFATMPGQRGKGYGKQILNRFLRRDDLPVWLEVELPEDDMKQRRICFYQRSGFHLNYHFYQQLPYTEGKSLVELLWMTYPFVVSENDVALFIRKYHPILFGT